MEKLKDISYEEFKTWAQDNFEINKFFAQLEIVPLPTTEREVIHDIIQHSLNLKSVSEV